ncbi:MAG: MBL fold metallo-hydrolase [Actinobacteria bacterium]|nr:MBL fold metallo-hydrolase [Actinomycetota bacterium]
MQMRLTVIGCSPAWPNPGGAQSGYLVEGPEGRILLDCGAGVLAKFRALEDWPSLDAICITHFHLDHWGDLVPWVWALSFGPASDLPTPELWVPPGGRAMLAGLGERLGTPDMFEKAFKVSEYAAGDEFEIKGLRVTARQVLHYELEAYGFRVSSNGKAMAYSGDSGPSGELAELARDADLFLCEATLLQANPEGGARGHLAADEAFEAFEAAGAKRLLLTHRPFERPLGAGFEQVYDGFETEV